MEDAAVRVLDLFELYWFRQQILLPTPPPPPPPPAPPMNPQPRPPLLLRRHCRALSNGSSLAPSASLSIRPPSLIPNFFTKEAPPEALLPAVPLDAGAVDENSNGERRQRGRRLRRTKSKSLTELEFKELKGLIDLGFAFSHEETDPRLLKIVPGLRRSKAGSASGTASVARPYLSEAWEARSKLDLLNNWRFQDPGGGGANLKDQLRSWAHAVASTVVQ